MSISEKIETLRKTRGISLTHLNNAIGAYRGKITDVKSGKASFSDDEIRILAQELSTSADYLLGRTDEPARVGDDTEAIDPNKRALYDAIGRMTDAELNLLLERAMKIINSR